MGYGRTPAPAPAPTPKTGKSTKKKNRK